MQTTNSWTVIIVVLSAYFFCIYLFFAYLKWTSSWRDTFDPFVSLTESSADIAWRTGYRQGKRETKAKQKLKRLKKKRVRNSERFQENYFKENHGK